MEDDFLGRKEHGVKVLSLQELCLRSLKCLAEAEQGVGHGRGVLREVDSSWFMQMFASEQ